MLVSGDVGYNEAVQHGLIAALTDQSTAIAWIIGGADHTLINKTSTAYGTGQANTNFMIGLFNFSGGAARVCDDYTNSDTGTGVYSNWYLPSTDELAKLYTNRLAISGFTTDFYWSSSENTTLTAKAQSFSTGLPEITTKSYSNHSVRAVRSF